MLKITDRKKDIIITAAGKNIAPQKIENMLRLQKNSAQCAIYGDQGKYLTVLIGVEKEQLPQNLKNKKLEQLANDSYLREIIWKDIEIVNNKLARFETIKRFAIIPEEMSVENGLMTPSLKVKKNHLFTKYEDLIATLYPSQ